MNFLANALKFSAKADPPVVRLSSRRDAGGLIYLVEDNGVGFDMTDRDKLFVAFQRLHSGKEFEGSGLGLSIVERIVSRHGGMVGAESEPGKGATFWFTIPDPET
jgi:signal transduction histidine kinase